MKYCVIIKRIVWVHIADTEWSLRCVIVWKYKVQNKTYTHIWDLCVCVSTHTYTYTHLLQIQSEGSRYIYVLQKLRLILQGYLEMYQALSQACWGWCGAGIGRLRVWVSLTSYPLVLTECSGCCFILGTYYFFSSFDSNMNNSFCFQKHHNDSGNLSFTLCQAVRAFTCIVLFNPHNNPERYILLLSTDKESKKPGS